MRVIITFFFFLNFCISNCNAQDLNSVNEISKHQKLITEAYDVLETNKFLNFQDKHTLIYKIDGKVITEINLDNSSYKKDWKKIEQENINNYQKRKDAQYFYDNDKLIELRSENGNYGIRKDFKTIYNSKFFTLLNEKKYFVDDNYNRTESIINEYDNRNRVIKITRREEHTKKENNEQSIITVSYKKNYIIITSKSGIVVCELL